MSFEISSFLVHQQPGRWRSSAAGDFKYLYQQSQAQRMFLTENSFLKLVNRQKRQFRIHEIIKKCVHIHIKNLDLVTRSLTLISECLYSN